MSYEGYSFIIISTFCQYTSVGTQSWNIVIKGYSIITTYLIFKYYYEILQKYINIIFYYFIFFRTDDMINYTMYMLNNINSRERLYIRCNLYNQKDCKYTKISNHSPYLSGTKG